MPPLSRAALTAVAVSLAAFTLPGLHARAAGAGQSVPDEAALLARARAVHARAITIDTHVDIDPAHFTPTCNYTQRLTTQVNLPKMAEGGLDAVFLVVYAGQGPLTADGYASAYRQALAKFDAIHRLAEELAPDRVGLALAPADVRRLVEAGKRAVIIGVENGYPLGEDLGRLEEFYRRGARYLSMTHNGHSQLADSNTGERDGWKWNGLSPLGRQAVAEMNRLGMMIDVSHTSRATMMQTIALSKAPIIASHSSVRALADHSRNLDDEQLLALKKNGGVAQMVALSSYVKPEAPERAAALATLRESFMRTAVTGDAVAPPAAARPAAPPCPVEGAVDAGAGRGAGGRGGMLARLSPERRAEFERRLAEIEAKWPAAPRATVKDFVDHIDYAVKLIGIDHVGIASDFDGGGGVEGWSSAAESVNVTRELVRRGYTDEQIEKLWGGNLLRVWDEVARIGDASRRAAMPPGARH